MTDREQITAFAVVFVCFDIPRIRRIGVVRFLIAVNHLFVSTEF